ncbi:DoxX family protein [Allostreptomyces psammosilenae]|uniref:Putative oxidoreductase n=1 Tax=Allostreptomyces psammosilenae TaxID=1892865 RepID=A0A853A3L8_9ACTN|nr:DoxX family protein [Allostreptomyces psammosilenae]NYI05078.1 putative oxidoreductase [Allostreptomyces psammosilenae]
MTTTNTTAKTTTHLRDLALLAARVGLGVVLIAHGWQKFDEFGIEGTAASFDQMGVPLPTVSAWFAALVELVGGAALIIGLAVPLVGLLVVIDMIGAWWFVHRDGGIFVAEGGYELVLTIGVAALLLAAFGAGRWGLDRLLFGRRSRSDRRQTVPAH